MKRFLTSCLSFVALAAAISALPVSAQGGGDQTVVLETTKGRIVIRVFYSMVPYTAGRFLELVNNGFYNGLTFHRVENWVVQGGDPTGNGTGVLMDGQGRPQYLNLEIHPALNHNQAGAVAMARSSNPNSASCQFYITKCPMPQLNRNYAVFGRVIGGANAVMSMQRGDRILSATIMGQGGERSNREDGDSDAVPGATPDQPPAPAQSTAPPPVQQAPPPKPKMPGKYSLPGLEKPADLGQGAAPPARHSLPGESHGMEPPPPTPPPPQQQEPPKQEPPKKPEDSGF